MTTQIEFVSPDTLIATVSDGFAAMGFTIGQITTFGGHKFSEAEIQHLHMLSSAAFHMGRRLLECATEAEERRQYEREEKQRSEPPADRREVRVERVDERPARRHQRRPLGILEEKADRRRRRLLLAVRVIDEQRRQIGKSENHKSSSIPRLAQAIRNAANREIAKRF